MFESLSKAKQKWVRSLKQKKIREELNLFVVEGEKMVLEGLDGFSEQLEILVVEKNYVDLVPEKFVSQCYEVSKVELEQLSDLKTPNKLLAVFRRKEQTPQTTGKILVLDGVQDPGNMGTIMRIADWFGIQQVICSSDTVDVYNPKVVQATMGAIFRVQTHYTSLPEYLKQTNLPVYAALLDGENFQTLTYPTDLLLIMGNEGNGIRPEVLPFVTQAVTIPRIGNAESLNVGVATAILSAEICLK